jgi:RecJ-like exonuclease
MFKETKEKIGLVECRACNGSLNSYDFYSCPICQGTGFVEVQAFKEAQLPLGNPVADAKRPVKEMKPMLKETKRRIGLVDCWACNGSLNSYDSYSCPICQGTGFVEVLDLPEAVLPKAGSSAEILTPVEEILPKTGSVADGYEFCVEHL